MEHASARTYQIGLAISILCTLAAFGLVYQRLSGAGAWLPYGLIVSAIVALALAQFAAQLICFLHLGRGAAARLNLAMFGLAAILAIIVVGGALWIMTSLNSRMMLSPEQQMQYMQQQSAAM